VRQSARRDSKKKRNGIYHLEALIPAKTEDRLKSADAKLFWNGRSQAVRLPKEFRFEGDRVRVTRMGAGVLIEPIAKVQNETVEEWFPRMDAMGGDPIFPEGAQAESGADSRVLQVSYLLDADVCIALINGKSSKACARFAEATHREEKLATSTIVVHQLWHRAANNGSVTRYSRALAVFLSRDVEILDHAPEDTP